MQTFLVDLIQWHQVIHQMSNNDLLVFFTHSFSIAIRAHYMNKHKSHIERKIEGNIKP